MAKATTQNTGRHLAIEDHDPEEWAVLGYFRANGLAAEESCRQSAFSTWMTENVPGLTPEARTEAFKRLLAKGWVGTNRDGAVWLTQDGFREAHR